MIAEDIARMYRKTIAYVRKRASLDKWRRVHHDGRTHYHPDDVDRSFGK